MSSANRSALQNKYLVSAVHESKGPESTHTTDIEYFEWASLRIASDDPRVACPCLSPSNLASRRDCDSEHTVLTVAAMPRLPLHLFRALRTVQAQAHHLPFLNHHAAVIPATRLSFLATRPPPMSLGSLLPMANGPTFTPASVQVRHKARGNEYQPSQRVRKRRHGFLARQRSVGGRKILARRKAKQRRFLSH